MTIRAAFPLLVLFVMVLGFPAATAGPPKPDPGALVHDHPNRMPASLKPPKGEPKPYLSGKTSAARNPCHIERYAKLDAKVAELSATAEGRALLAANRAKIKAEIFAGCE